MKIITKILLITLIFWLAGLVYFIEEIKSAKFNQLKKTDYIYVLTGDKNRIDTGFNLLIEGWAEKLFISGVGSDSTINDIMKNQTKALDKSRIKDKVKLGQKARTTVGNALELTEIHKNEKINSIILVTSSYHMIRAKFIFAKMAPNVEIIEFSSSSSEFLNNRWWENDRNLYLVISEYNKLIWFLIRYYLLGI